MNPVVFGTLAWAFGYRRVFLGCALLSVGALALMAVPARKPARLASA